MSARYAPFSPGKILQLRSLLATPPRSLDELARVRSVLSGESVSFDGLRALCESEVGFTGRLVGRVIPAVFAHAQQLVARTDATLDTLAPGVDATRSLPRDEVAGWVAHMVLGTLPSPGPAYPDVDAARLLHDTSSQQLAKLRCVCAYFDRIADGAPRGRVTVTRRTVPARTAMEWSMDPSPLTALTVDTRGAIEDADGHLQVDFANAYLGGGVLRTGCVQEEIRFVVAPEHLAAMLATPRMRDDESITVHGAERFARTSGYAFSLRYAGALHDPAPREADGSVDVDFVAIDAIDYRRGDPHTQFTEASMLRELTKARAGFVRDGRGLPVATGNWGCGAFRGDHALKAVIQWAAASAEGRAVRYCTFGDAAVGELQAFADGARAQGLTVGALWSRLRSRVDDGGAGLYARLLR